jgi:hypothetical protein
MASKKSVVFYAALIVFALLTIALGFWLHVQFIRWAVGGSC